ncbi:trigger factor [Chloroflexota bacterium]
MKVSTENTENRQAILSIEAEPQEMQESLDMAYNDLKKRVSIPGFRRGKTPRSILEQYIGKEELQREALEHLVPQLCNQAMQEQEIDAIAQPEIEIVQVDPVVFKATFPLRPQVELGEYRQIKLIPDPVEVTEEQIDSAMERIREQYAVWSPVERSLQLEDMAVIDIEQMEEGNIVNSYQGQQLPVMPESMLPLPGFAEQLVGMEIGEEREFALDYAEDYHIERLRGEKYNFKVKLGEVKEKQLPEMNDEFAKNFGGDFETIGALRESMVTSLKSVSEGAARRAFEQHVVEAAVEMAKVEFPPILEEQEINRFMSERERMLQGQGGLEAYLKNMNKSEEEMREEIRPEANMQVVQSLVLGKVAAEENVEVGAAEIDIEIENMLKTAGGGMEEMQKMLETPRGRQWVEERLVVQKTVQCLAQIASDNAAGENGGDAGEGGSDAGEDDNTAQEGGDACGESGNAAEEEG